MSILSPEQKQQYEAQGYLLASGLIAPEIAEAGAAALWQSLGAQPDDPTTWANVAWNTSHNAPAILACFTPQMQQAASELAEEDLIHFPAPKRILALNVFPQEGPWSPHPPHIDHAIPRDGYRVFPRPLRVASITYLNDVPPQGAGTVVWPGSHKKIEALARSNPDHYELMATLNGDLAQLDLGEPIEIQGRRGDVLFYHYLCAHSGSRNATDQPRLALVYKW